MQSYILRIEKDSSAAKSLSPKNQKPVMYLLALNNNRKIIGLVFVIFNDK